MYQGLSLNHFSYSKYSNNQLLHLIDLTLLFCPVQCYKREENCLTQDQSPWSDNYRYFPIKHYKTDPHLLIDVEPRLRKYFFHLMYNNNLSFDLY